jgi:hypothetical protein
MMEISIQIKDGETKEFEIIDKDVREFVEENWEEVDEKINLALKIGVGAIKASSTTVDTNYVDKEFQRLSGEFNERFRNFQEDWEKNIVSVFGEDFVKMQDSLDPDRPDTPNRKMVEYMDERIKQLILEMDPNEEGTPIGKFRKEMIDHMTELRELFAGKKAADEEREKGTGKGRPYEENVFLALHDIGARFGDTVLPTGDESDIGRGKKGDVISEINEVEGLKVVFEAKKRKINLNQTFYDEEIKGAMAERGATKAVLVVHPEYVKVKTPLSFWKEAIVCLYDPEVGDTTALEVGYQLSRRFAIDQVTEGEAEIDMTEFKARLNTIQAYIKHIAAIEGQMSKSIDGLNNIKADLRQTKENLREELDELLNEIEIEEE